MLIRRSPNGAHHPYPQGGRDPPEPVVAINRNGRSRSIGMPGRDHSVRALTFVPFGLVALKLLPAVPTLTVIAVLALLQIIIHLRYFLHLDLSPKRRESIFALAFAAVIVFIMVGGTVWILFNLQYRMMA